MPSSLSSINEGLGLYGRRKNSFEPDVGPDQCGRCRIVPRLNPPTDQNSESYKLGEAVIDCQA